MFEHEVTVCRETDALIHELLGKSGEPPPYSSDDTTARSLARALGIAILPMHEPNHAHFFDSVGVLPEHPPIGFLGVIDVEPSDMDDDLLLQHGWQALAEAPTLPLAVCLAVHQVYRERVKGACAS